MSQRIKIFVDFNNNDSKRRIRLNTTGTLRDIQTNNLTLVNGLELFLDDEDSLSVIGTVEFSAEENIWVAVIDWEKL